MTKKTLNPEIKAFCREEVMETLLPEGKGYVDWDGGMVYILLED